VTESNLDPARAGDGSSPLKHGPKAEWAAALICYVG
jgi:hypothetical protein